MPWNISLSHAKMNRYVTCHFECYRAKLNHFSCAFRSEKVLFKVPLFASGFLEWALQ